MKLFLLFFLFVFYNLFGQNYLKISDETYNINTPVNIYVNLFNTDEVVGYQFDINHSPLFEYSGEFELSNRYSDHSVAVNVVNDSTIRVLCFSLNNLPLNNSDSIIITLLFNKINNVGNYLFKLKNAIVSNSTGQNLLDTVKNGLITITDPASVNTEKIESVREKINVYPNPFNNETNIIYESEKTMGSIYIRVFDVLGNLVFHKEFLKNQYKFQYKFNSNKLSTGIYFLNLLTPTGELNQKILYLK